MPRGDDDSERLERIDRLLDQVLGEVWKSASADLCAPASPNAKSGAVGPRPATRVVTDRGPPAGVTPVDASPAERRELDLEVTIEREIPVIGEIFTDARLWLDRTAAALAASEPSTAERAKAVSLLESVQLGADASPVWRELATLFPVDASTDLGTAPQALTPLRTLLQDLQEVLKTSPAEAYTLVAFPIHVARLCANNESTRRLAADRARIVQGLRPESRP
jgi:hypothetical protein